MSRTLTADQEQALVRFAKDHGRNWKSALRNAWMTGNYHGRWDDWALQQVRNSFGPSWLVTYRLPILKVSDRSLDIPAKEQI